MSVDEESAYERLSKKLDRKPVGTEVEVTGAVKKNDLEFFLEVRTFQMDLA
jgi:hypothetical protein